MKYQVQLAQSVLSMDALPKGGDYVLEPKFDGWRMVAHIWQEGGVSRVDFYTRTGEYHSGGRFPLIEAELLASFPSDTWLDGELVCLTPDGDTQCDWAKVQNFAGSKDRVDIKGELSYAAFDIMVLGDHPAISVPFKQRRELLDKALDGQDLTHVFKPVQLPATQEIHDRLLAIGWEGSIVKDNYAPYSPGKRGRGQFKIKGVWTTEGIVMDFQDGKNGFAGMVGAIIFGQYNEAGVLEKRGKCSGFDLKLRQELTDEPEAFKGKIIEVQHNGVMPSGGLRHPQFLRFRTDKNPADVVWNDK